MPFTAIFNCDLFLPDMRISQGLVLIEGREIRAVGRSYDISLPTSTRLIDAQGGRVTPGLIDLGGVEFGGRQQNLSTYRLATLDQLRSTDRSVLRSLLSSHHLILTGDSIQPLSTRSIRQLMALAETDFTKALTAATLAPAEFLGLPVGRLAAGAPADLICWTRHGDLAWSMVGGEIVHPDPKATSSLRQQSHRDQQSQIHDSAFRQQAIIDIHHFLESRDDTLAVHHVGNQPRSKRKGIDLRWRFSRDDGGEETVSIGVQMNGGEEDDSITFTTRNEPSTTSACSLEHTQADWCFYYAAASQRLVCLPVRATRAWLHEQHNNADLAIPIIELQVAIPRLRLLHLNPKRSGKKDETDQN